MLAAAEGQDYERAAELRDRVIQLKKQLGEPLTAAGKSWPPTPWGNEKEKGKGAKRECRRSGGRVPKPER